MRKAALYVRGRIVIGDSHLEAYHKLTIVEQCSESLISGVFDLSTDEFCGDSAKDHFFNKEILLVRHAAVSKADNPDPELSTEGVLQAQDVAHRLLGLNLSNHETLSSPLLRCLQTASILATVLGKKVCVEPLLAETPEFLQDDEEFCVPNRRSSFPDFSWPTSEKFVYKKEPSSEFLDRARAVLHSLPQKTIVITHYGFICNMLRLAFCDDRANMIANHGIPPASITYVKQQEIECLGWNNAKYHQNQPETSHC